MQLVRAKKSLGQHFLKDLGVAKRIAETVQDRCAQRQKTAALKDERLRVLEIGPGMGVLTQYLLQNKDIDLTAVELDHESVVYLNEWYPELKVIEADFLKLNLDEVYPEGEFSVIGNYPYNISSQILFKVLEYKDRIPVCSGMLQKEVAERLSSKPGTKAYGILSVLLQAWYDIEYLFTVDKQLFNPPPKVQSAVIRLTRNRRRQLDCDEGLFKTVVKTAFNQRRKQMRNSLKGVMGYGLRVMGDAQRQKTASLKDEKLEWFLTKRPEQLDVEEFVELTKLLQSCRN